MARLLGPVADATCLAAPSETMPPSNPKQPPAKTAEGAAGKAQDRAPRIGEVLADNYRLVREIGRGAMGAVYLAEDLALERQVAVKVFRPLTNLSNEDALRRFRHEGASASRLQHPNAVTILDSGVAPGGIPYLAMELLVGRTLADELKEKRVLSLARTVQIILPVCDVLIEAHAATLVHRDIKPWNFPLLDLPKFLRGEFRGNTAQLIPRFSRRVNKKIPDGTFGIGLQVRRIHWDFLAYRRYCALL